MQIFPESASRTKDHLVRSVLPNVEVAGNSGPCGGKRPACDVSWCKKHQLLRNETLMKFITLAKHLKADCRLGWPKSCFPLIKENYSVSAFVQSLSSTKRAPKLSIFHVPTKRSVWVFDVTNRAIGFSSFQSYHVVVMYLFNSLAEGCTLF